MSLVRSVGDVVCYRRIIYYIHKNYFFRLFFSTTVSKIVTRALVSVTNGDTGRRRGVTINPLVHVCRSHIINIYDDDNNAIGWQWLLPRDNNSDRLGPTSSTSSSSPYRPRSSEEQYSGRQRFCSMSLLFAPLLTSSPVLKSNSYRALLFNDFFLSFYPTTSWFTYILHNLHSMSFSIKTKESPLSVVFQIHICIKEKIDF